MATAVRSGSRRRSSSRSSSRSRRRGGGRRRRSTSSSSSSSGSSSSNSSGSSSSSCFLLLLLLLAIPPPLRGQVSETDHTAWHRPKSFGAVSPVEIKALKSEEQTARDSSSLLGGPCCGDVLYAHSFGILIREISYIVFVCYLGRNENPEPAKESALERQQCTIVRTRFSLYHDKTRQLCRDTLNP